ncbi:MAG: DUF2284 domain-containing protein [Treponema sp.]|jgi:predicted metal-binding protein|nr:DUF2284 domain-containing protein [Treponema sp.]
MNETIKKALTVAETLTGVKVHECAEISTSALIFSPELLKSCETNVCGQYNKSWTCPPASDTLEVQREKIHSFKKVFVFTTKHDLEDSFDYEGMTLGRERHTLLTLEFRSKTGGDLPFYGAGACPSCRDEEGKNNCAFPEPCPFPEKRIGSIEAAGINVSELSKSAGIAYNNGINTVTYFSMILLS